MTWILDIPLEPKSMNHRLRQHWGEAKRVQAIWMAHLWAAARLQRVPAAITKRRVTITSYRHGELDFDNLVAACKEVILDNLRPPKFEKGVYKTGKRKGEYWQRHRSGLGLIFEDSPTWLEAVYRQEKISRSKPVRTVIEIEDA